MKTSSFRLARPLLLAAPLAWLTVSFAWSKTGAAHGATMPASATHPRAASERILYRFQGPPNDGEGPPAGLVADRTGALYGTTAAGGSGPCRHGCGIVFELTPSGSAYRERVLYSFKGEHVKDGAHPAAGLLLDAQGALYGTTYYGGGGGEGTVFKITPSGSGYTESILYSFRGGPSDGAHPWARLIADASGALYGTTEGGGLHPPCKVFVVKRCGTVFKLAPSPSGYVETILYRFKGVSRSHKDGAFPSSGLLSYSGGRLIGTTGVGGGVDGYGNGTVFELRSKASGGYVERLVWHFSGGDAGMDPLGDLIVDSSGMLYGTTEHGGGYERGNVYALTPSGHAFSESNLYSFKDGSDGAYPEAGLASDGAGNLYGTTWGGGCRDERCGIVFMLTRSGSGYTESILHTFHGGRDGAHPLSALIVDDAGNLYGTTGGGGGGPCRGGCGTVFEVVP